MTKLLCNLPVGYLVDVVGRRPPLVLGAHLGLGVGLVLGAHLGLGVGLVLGAHLGLGVGLVLGAHLGLGVGLVLGAHLGLGVGLVLGARTLTLTCGRSDPALNPRCDRRRARSDHDRRRGHDEPAGEG